MKTKTGLLAAAAAFVALGAAGMAQAGTLTAIASYVDVNGGTTKVLDINNAGWMTGNIVATDFTSQGFSRDAAGTYSLFSIGTAGSSTFGRAISNTNVVSGYATAPGGNINTDTEFQRTNGGVVTALTNPNTGNPLHGIAQGTNASGIQVGDYYSGGAGGTTSPILGYELSADGVTLTTLSGPAGATRAAARGIADDGTVAGWAVIGGVAQGFIYSSGGIYSLFSHPLAAGGNTYFEDINNNGIIAGDYQGADTFFHAFEFDSHTNIFTDIVVAGADNVQAFGLNDAGDVVITTDLQRGPNNFIYNNAGVPEPASWALMLVGFFGLGSALRRRRATLAV